MNDPQGDKAIIPLLQSIGASILVDAKTNTLTIEPGRNLQGRVIDVNDCIDAVPILAVLACYVSGRTEIVNASMARNKESDRISCICQELKKMGAQVEEKPDGLVIEPTQLYGNQVFAHHDHRIALALAVAALGAQGPSEILGTECIAKTYPSFVEDFSSIGAHVYE